MNAWRLAILAMVLALVWSAGAVTAAPDRVAKKRVRPLRGNVVDNSQQIDINNIAMYVTNTGSFAWDKQTGNSGLEFPKGTHKTAVFAAGLWMGARVGGQIRVSVSEYSDDYDPGPYGQSAAAPEHKTYKLNRVYTDPAVRDAALADYNAGAVPDGAPAIVVLPDGTLEFADTTGTPGSMPDQMTWAVYNDNTPASRRNDASSKLPLGVEVQQLTFAFQRQGALGNTVFIKYTIINKGGNNLTDMYVSQWSDPDLGGASDDLVGTDTTLSLGFVYNATANDNQYGAESPAVGYDFLQGPTPPGDTIPLGMSSFNKYINGTDPDDSTKTYNYMQGLNADGSPVVNPVTGQVTRYVVSGDPVTGSGWLDTAPADRRLMLSSGPFTMAPGDTQVVVTGIVVGQSRNRLASISLMKFFDISVQAAYDANFDLPSPPQSPDVAATPRSGCVHLTWEPNAEAYDEDPYEFEGYNVYQGASIAGPWVRIATYDKVNGVTVVLDDDFNEDQGLILPTGKAFGTDIGLRYQIEICNDVIRGGPLYNAQTYYFAVTAYSVGDSASIPRVLESPFEPIIVTPQTRAAGVDPNSALITPVTHTAGPSTDIVTATVVNPDSVKTASYEVGFKPAGPTSTTMVWYVVRTMGTQVDTVVNNWPNFSPDEANPIVDGVQIKISSYPLGELADVAWVDTTGGNPQPIVGAHVDLRFFDTGADYADLLFGSSIAAYTTPSPNIMVRFGPPFQRGYRYLRSSSTPRTYLLQDFVDVPFTVWNLDTGQQLNVGWLENEPGSADDGVWDPPADGIGGRELIWPMSSLYTGVQDPYYSDPSRVDALSGNVDFWYVLWPDRVAPGAPWDTGDKILFRSSVPAGSSDKYAFSTTAANRLNLDLARAELAAVKAVPNPYYAHSSYETSQFSRILKITHLPERCTIRFFNLAGDLVRTLEKNDPSSIATWNLQTDNGLPVGSGIYIFHVDAPGIGTTTGKVAVFMERERLNNF